MDRLEIQNLAIIDALGLDLHPGLNVFTGETGAGKSIIVDAILLLTGVRAETELVRQGSESLLVTGFWAEGSVSRRISEQGRSTARIDGEVVSVRELGEHAQKHITVHWQHAAQALLHAAHHREILDKALPKQSKLLLENYRKTHREKLEVQARLDALRESERDRVRRNDVLAYQLQEIESANLRGDEETQIRLERERLANAESIATHASIAAEALNEAEINAASLVADAVKALQQAARFDGEAAQLAGELKDSLGALQAIAREARGLADNAQHDPVALDQLEARLALLERLKGKYGATLGDVLDYGEGLREELATLLRVNEDLGNLEGQAQHLEKQLQALAQDLSQARVTLAATLGPKLQHAVRHLGMPKARLEFALSPLGALGAFGAESVEIRFSANSGEPLGPLNRIASGGELSRVMLALSTLVGADTPSVIFDEVDAGIGGQAALMVAENLAGLAQAHQVLVVTHLAQIAARADQHFCVRKEEQQGRTRVVVQPLQGEERVQELARMLSGNTSSAALEHARELLAAAQSNAQRK